MLINNASQGFLEFLFILNLLLFIVLSIEPFWRLGAWLIYLVMVEVFLFIINLFYVKKFIFISSIFNLAVIFFGIIIAFFAHIMKSQEDKSKNNFEKPKNKTGHDEEGPKENSLKENSEKEISKEENPNEENTEETKKEIKETENKSYVLSRDNVVHSFECDLLDSKEDATVIGSKRYAESKKYKVCEVCRPF